MKGCNKYLYTEGDYHQLCDGVELCNGTLRLCKDCENEYDGKKN